MDDQRLLEICMNISTEKDSEKLAGLIRELNQELQRRGAKKLPQSSKNGKRDKHYPQAKVAG